MAVSHGADSARLREVGTELRSSSELLSDLATTGRAMAQILAEHWHGADMEYLVAQAWPGAERQLHDGSRMVQAMGEAALRNADQQDDVSEGDAAVGGGSATGQRADGDRTTTMYGGGDEPEYGSLDPEVFGMYLELDEEQRRAVLQEIVNQQAAEAGVDPPQIVFEDLDGGTIGSWNQDEGVLTIDSDVVNDNPRMAINTAVHETRHAEQGEVIEQSDISNWFTRLFGDETEVPEGYNVEQVEAWAENDRNYESPPTDEQKEKWDEDRVQEAQQAYYDQPLEVDARREGEQYVDDLTPEDFEDIVDEAVEE